MPSFLFRSRRIEANRVAGAMDLAARRYPELAVTHRYTLRDSDAEIWVVDAPNSVQVEDWAQDSEIVAGRVHRADDTPTLFNSS